MKGSFETSFLDAIHPQTATKTTFLNYVDFSKLWSLRNAIKTNLGSVENFLDAHPESPENGMKVVFVWTTHLFSSRCLRIPGEYTRHLDKI